jgi:hypothetical protein
MPELNFTSGKPPARIARRDTRLNIKDVRIHAYDPQTPDIERHFMQCRGRSCRTVEEFFQAVARRLRLEY